MQLPSWLFAVGLWCALALVAGAAVYLIAVLIREWRGGDLW